MTPSLVALCLRIIAHYPDQVHALPIRLRLRPHLARALIDDLVPDPANPDPALWAVLAQLYAPLPSYLAVCELPLYAPQLPLLQNIPPTPLFSLLTLLDLSATQHLTDDSIHLLRFLHSLTALDASTNPVSAYAVRSLAATIHPDGQRHRGPGELRVLALRNCKRVTNDVYPELDKFPLLAVVDLRGTTCTRYVATKFKPCTDDSLYYPAPLRDSLAALHTLQPDLAASEKPYIISIDKLHPPETRPAQQGRVGVQDSFVVFPSNYAAPIKIGNTHVYARETQAREDQIRHDQNKRAWYDRQEILEDQLFLAEQQNPRSENSPPVHNQHQGAISSASTRLVKLHVPRTSDLPPRMAAPTGRRSVVASDTTPVARVPSISTATTSTPSHRLPHYYHQASAPQRSHHTSVSPPSTSTTRAHAQVHTVQGPGSATGDQPQPAQAPGPAQRALTMAVTNPGAIGHRAPTGGQPRPSTSAFYTRAAPRVNASSAPTKPPQSSASRNLLQLSAHLKLLRPPPAYAVLAEALARRESTAQRGDRDGTGASALDGTVGKDEGKGRRMKEAMEAALKDRVRPVRTPLSEFGAEPNVGERRRSAMGIAMSAPVFSVQDAPAPAKRYSISTLAASFAPAPAPLVPRTRNPFRKRVTSYPDMPAFGGAAKNSAAPVSVSAAASSSSAPAKKAREAGSSNTVMASSSTTKTSLPTSASTSSSATPIRRQPSLAPVPLAKPALGKSRSGAAVSVMDTYPPHDAKQKQKQNVNTKPLMPISAVKIPVLTDEMRREALRREALEVASMASARKRASVRDEDEGGEGEGEEGWFSDSGRPPAKKRAITKGRSSAASLSSLRGGEKGKEKEKEKEKEKMKAFDWNGWGKKGQGGGA